MEGFLDKKIPFLPSKKSIFICGFSALACAIYLWFAIFAPNPLISYDGVYQQFERNFLFLAILAIVGVPIFSIVTVIQVWSRLNPNKYIFLRGDHVLFPAFGIRFKPTKIEYLNILDVNIEKLSSVPDCIKVIHLGGSYDCMCDFLGSKEQALKFVNELRARVGLDMDR